MSSLFRRRWCAAGTLGAALPIQLARSWCFVYPHHKQCRKKLLFKAPGNERDEARHDGIGIIPARNSFNPTVMSLLHLPI